MKSHTFQLPGLLLVLGLGMLSCKSNEAKVIAKTSTVFYVGTYTGESSQGIYKYSIDSEGVMNALGLVAETTNPSFLAISPDRRHLIACNEIKDNTGQGRIESYSIKDDRLELLSSSPSGGAHPCHVSIDPNGVVLVANYSGGNVSLLKMDQNGVLSDLLDTKQHSGSSITSRQQGPHAHSIWSDPHTNTIVAVDLGIDKLVMYELNEAASQLVPSNPPSFSMPPGSGPRHLCIHPSKRWIYVINELSNSISHLQWVEGTGYTLEQTYETLPEDFEGENTCADIKISADGRFVYGSNRGHNSIVIFEVNPESGTLMLVGHQSTMGSNPRNFNLTPDEQFLIVANQSSNNLISFARDEETGLLSQRHEMEAYTPVCIVF